MNKSMLFVVIVCVCVTSALEAAGAGSAGSADGNMRSRVDRFFESMSRRSKEDVIRLATLDCSNFDRRFHTLEERWATGVEKHAAQTLGKYYQAVLDDINFNSTGNKRPTKPYARKTANNVSQRIRALAYDAGLYNSGWLPGAREVIQEKLDEVAPRV